MTDIAPRYPAADITPGPSPAPTPRSSGNSSAGVKLRRVLQTRAGRAGVAAAVAVVLVLLVMLRRGGGAAAPEGPTSTPMTTNADPLAGLGGADITASPVPPGGFDFTGSGGGVFNPNPGVGTSDPGTSEPVEPAPVVPPEVHVVIDLPPQTAAPATSTGTSGAGATGSVTPTTIAKALPMGYYRGAWTSGFTYQDGKGHAISKPLTDAQRTGIAGVETKMRAAMKANANAPALSLTIGGIYHRLTNDGAIRPAAAS